MTIEQTAATITTRLLQDADAIRVLGRINGSHIGLTDALEILRATIDQMLAEAAPRQAPATAVLQ